MSIQETMHRKSQPVLSMDKDLSSIMVCMAVMVVGDDDKGFGVLKLSCSTTTQHFQIRSGIHNLPRLFRICYSGKERIPSLS